MSSTALEPVRRHLTGRPADTVARLVEAAVEEVTESGYDGLTVRGVARRAGVAPATAYTYFAGKDHLLAEVFWRRLQALPEPRLDRRRNAADRVADAVAGMALLVADDSELSAAVTTAMLAHDADVKRLRDAIGAVFVERLDHALGSDSDPAILEALTLAWTGAMLMAGMGNLAYAELAERMAAITALMMRPGRRPR
jgi:AcrR family transcriptional regulator